MTAICPICPRHCSIEEGKLGFCRARKNEGGTVICDNYGRLTSMALDPIEKKPLRRFHPGSMIINNIFFGCAGVCLLLGAKTGSVALIVAGLVFIGTGYGGNPTLTSAIIQRLYGPKNYSVNFSVANFSLIPAAIIGPMVSSSLIERAGGKYDSTFMMVVVLAVAAAAVWVVMVSAYRSPPSICFRVSDICH